MNSLWPTISVPPGATCTATGATSHTQTGWGISNRRYLGSYTPALTATCASGNEGRRPADPNSKAVSERGRTVSPPNSSNHSSRPSSLRRRSSIAIRTHPTASNAHPTRPRDHARPLRLPLPEHPPGQGTLLSQPSLLPDASSVPQRARPHLLLESHRDPRRQTSSLHAPDLGAGSQGARRLARRRSALLCRAQPWSPRPLLARHARSGGQPVLCRPGDAEPAAAGRGPAPLV